MTEKTKKAILILEDMIDGAIADKELADKTGLSKEIEDVILSLQISMKCLQSELDRQKGCRHCTGAIVGIYEVDESCCLTVFDIGAKHCPICGRKL